MFRTLLFVSLCLVVKSDVIHKKYCADVDKSACLVTAVEIEPCRHAPRLCNIIRGKSYSMFVSFVPNFTAENVKLSISGDHLNSGNYTLVKTTKRICEENRLICPLEPSIRQSMQLDFSIDEKFSGKFPAQVKFWNADNEDEACCFTFTVKMK